MSDLIRTVLCPRCGDGIALDGHGLPPMVCQPCGRAAFYSPVMRDNVTVAGAIAVLERAKSIKPRANPHE